MSATSAQTEFLVLSRGKWDEEASKADIEDAITKFYDWLARNIDEGRMKMGSRLSTDRAVVSKAGIVTDGPFGEAKEVIGGYWIIMARNLREAAELAAQNPCTRYGLHFEIRPLEPACASVHSVTNETPASWKEKPIHLAEHEQLR